MATAGAMPNGQVSHNEAHKVVAHERKVIVGPKNKVVKAKAKTEDDSLAASLCMLICDHQIGISVNLLLLLALTHIFFPRARRRTSKFFHLSYYKPETNQYGCGTDDLPFVILWTVIFTGLRVAVMDYVLDPLARLGGIRTKKGLDRFKEQGWLIVYYTASWSLGMYIMYHSNFWFNLRGVWEDWPIREIDGLFKWYYLVQWGFWIQQVLVVNIEEKRKDYAQMFTHHIFTIALMFLSYGYYHMRIGTVILCIMDFVDILLPTAKLLKYTGFSNACDVAFGVFVIGWLLTRHIFYMMVCWSIYAHAPLYIAAGCYYADGTIVLASQTEEYNALGGNKIWSNLLTAYTDPNGVTCWNPTTVYYFLALLLTLQVFCIMWFITIAKIIYGVLRGQNADDLRSDDEGEDEDVDVKDDTASVLNAAKTGAEFVPLEQDVGAEALNFTRRGSPASTMRGNRRQTRSSSSRASGISIPGHGDRKELLGRIGCDKPT